jgi:hypothetical protein
MPEREDNPAEQAGDSSETRDFELPPMEGEDPGGGAGEAPDARDRPAPPEPADASERRDWDLP